MSSTPPTGRSPDVYEEVQQSEKFGELRRTHRSFAFPLTVGFITWYLLYVLLSNYAGGFMGTEVVGNINVAFVLGIAQFVTTFALAWWYARHAGAKLDPRSEQLKQDVERRLAGGGTEVGK